MHYKLNLVGSKSVDLSFSMYFLGAVGRMAKMGIQQSIRYLIGDEIDIEKGIVRGGIMDDLHVRAIVVAAGMEATGFAKGDYTQYSPIDAYPILQQVPDTIKNPAWGEIFGEIVKAFIVTDLPREEKPPKKGTAKPNTSSRTSSTPRLVK